jgi:2-oxoisovalerate dehydrogenase E1 component
VSNIDPALPASLQAALLEAIQALAPTRLEKNHTPSASSLMTSSETQPLDGSESADKLQLRADLWALFTAQCLSRHTDLVARRLRSQGHGYYTIGSAGHESNAAIALATRATDPALLHYRSGGFYIARSLQAGAPSDPVDDILAGMLAHTDEPIAGGRHKVFGHPDTAIIPQTSTIASHLPRAVGVALAIGRAKKLGVELRWPIDAIAVCSFGDASANHSTALGAINAASHLAYQLLPVPLLFVCEDNGIGISVRTPAGWIESSFCSRPGLRYVSVDGSDAVATLQACHEVVAWIRKTRRPVFLHIRTVRFLGHAGTDVERGYRSIEEIRSSFAHDPILGTAQALSQIGIEPTLSISEYRRCGEYVEALSTDRLARGRELTSAREVMAAIAPRPEPTIAPASSESIPFAPATGGSTLAQAINSALSTILEDNPDTLLFGEDVAVKGGVYGVTKGLLNRFGAARVFDTLLDEQSILGVALGTAVSGLLPIAEIEYLAYLHNAEDQLRGEAATLQFFSKGAYRNGMIVRVAGYGYQKGFGGHFHNDDSIAVLRDIPGLVIASPARPSDAAEMLRTLTLCARKFGTVGVIVEPIALYHQADLHNEGDRLWLEPVPETTESTAVSEIGTIRRYGPDDADVTIVTWANGLWMSLRVAARMAIEPDPIRCNVIDLRWIAPLPIDAILACNPSRILVVDETRRSGGVSEGILAGLIDRNYTGPMARVTSKDSFIPLGDAANLILLSEHEIEQGIRDLAARRSR